MSKLEKILSTDGGWINVVADIPEQYPKALIILCHGLTGDRSGPQRILTGWAKTLAENHFLVVRFDFRGSGDSSGSFEKTTLLGMEKDLASVIDWCYSYFSFPLLILSGLSLGGLVALNTASQRQDCLALFLFSTDLNDFPSFYLESDPVPIRNGQFFLHKIFFDERVKVFPNKQLSALSAHKFLFYGEHDSKISQISKELPNSIHANVIKETGHLFESLSARAKAVELMIFELNKLLGVLV